MCITPFHYLWKDSSVHEPQAWKRKESRNGSNRGPSAYERVTARPKRFTGRYKSIESTNNCVKQQNVMT